MFNRLSEGEVSIELETVKIRHLLFLTIISQVHEVPNSVLKLLKTENTYIDIRLRPIVRATYNYLLKHKLIRPTPRKHTKANLAGTVDFNQTYTPTKAGNDMVDKLFDVGESADKVDVAYLIVLLKKYYMSGFHTMEFYPNITLKQFLALNNLYELLNAKKKVSINNFKPACKAGYDKKRFIDNHWVLCLSDRLMTDHHKALILELTTKYEAAP